MHQSVKQRRFTNEYNPHYTHSVWDREYYLQLQIRKSPGTSPLVCFSDEGAAFFMT